MANISMLPGYAGNYAALLEFILCNKLLSIDVPRTRLSNCGLLPVQSRSLTIAGIAIYYSLVLGPGFANVKETSGRAGGEGILCTISTSFLCVLFHFSRVYFYPHFIISSLLSSSSISVSFRFLFFSFCLLHFNPKLAIPVG